MKTPVGQSVSMLYLVGSAVDNSSAELSRLYAKASVESFVGDLKYDVHLAYVSPDGRWRFPADLSADAIESSAVMTLPEAMSHIVTMNPDVVLPQMFCVPGMTRYRALFDLLGVDYLGSPPDVMAIGADKVKARAVVSAAGVAVPDGEIVRRGEKTRLAFPVVVKPVAADNSDGVSLVRSEAEFAGAVERAAAFGDEVLVESYIALGREVRCGIVVRDGSLLCLPLEEYAVNPDSKPIRGRDDKLARTASGDLFLVAKDSERAWIVEDDVLTERVWQAARRCHVALGCRHYSLFDFRIDPDGKPWFLEAGLYCSYAPTSVIAVMAAATGIDLGQLLDIGLAELAREGA